MKDLQTFTVNNSRNYDEKYLIINNFAPSKITKSEKNEETFTFVWNVPAIDDSDGRGYGA